MKVAMLADYPADSQHIVGGVQAVTVYLSRALADQEGVELHVITIDPSLRWDIVQPKGNLTVHRLHTTSRLRSLPKLFLVDIPRLWNRVRQLNVDLVHGQGADIYGYAALSAGSPAVITVHGILREDARYWISARNRFQGLLAALLFERRCIAKAGHIISISPYVQDYWKDRIKGQVHHVENPIDEAFFTLPLELAGPKAPVLFVGVVAPRKQLHHLLMALRILREARGDIALRVAGRIVDRAYFERLMRWIEENDMEGSVTFLGGLDEERLLDEYRRCRMLVLPSAQETAPMAIEQAMASGKPTVATKVGGIPYLLSHEESGLLVEPGDIEGLARAVWRLLEDDELAMCLGQRARIQALARFRASVVARKTLAVYQHIVGTGDSRLPENKESKGRMDDMAEARAGGQQ